MADTGAQTKVDPDHKDASTTRQISIYATQFPNDNRIHEKRYHVT